MVGIAEDYIVEYLRGLYPDNDPFLSELEDFALKNSVPIIERESLELLRFLVDFKKPKKILELGTAIGYSAIAMCMEGKDSQVYSLDIDEDIQKIARKNIEKIGFSDRIKLFLGDAKDLIPTMPDGFDMVFIDAAKSHYREYFDLSIEKLNDNSLIVSDNVLFKGLIANDDLVNRRARTLVRHMRDYLVFLTHTEGLKTTVLPVGDGVAITRVDLKKYKGV